MNSLTCIACNANETRDDKSASRYLSLPENLRIMRCGRCSLRWLSPSRSREEDLEIYRSSYFECLPEEYDRVVMERTTHFRERVNRMRRWFGNRSFSLLDIGAATGEFLREALNAGIQASGIEPSESACREAEEKYGIRMTRGDIVDVPLKRDSFDVIHMNHVFEHIPYPKECLRIIHQIMKGGGYLVIEVPYQFGNILERFCSFFGLVEPRPFSLYSIHHPFFYTPRSLRLLLENHGFRVSETRVWRLYLSLKLDEARRYCRLPVLSPLEKYIHLVNVILQEKGRSVSFEILARKPE